MEDNKVAILLEELQKQFMTFGEGLELLTTKVDKGFEDVNKRIDKLETKMDRSEITNRQEHQQLMQMVKELDQEVQVEIKRVK
jgi:hypothetical protein